jgi:hypothetical protein
VIRDRQSLIAKLIPLSSESASEEEMVLVATGNMRLPRSSLNVAELARIPTGKVANREGTQALLDERDETRYAK